jgi:hypothetical protein
MDRLSAALAEAFAVRQAFQDAGAACPDLSPDASAIANLQISVAALQSFAGRPITDLASHPSWSRPLSEWDFAAASRLVTDLIVAMLAATNEAARLAAAGITPAGARRPTVH